VTRAEFLAMLGDLRAIGTLEYEGEGWDGVKHVKLKLAPLTPKPAEGEEFIPKPPKTEEERIFGRLPGFQRKADAPKPRPPAIPAVDVGGTGDLT